jgi:cell division protein FtsB
MILKILKILWTALKNKVSIDFGKVGTHIQIGLTVILAFFIIITRQQTKQVDENTVQIKVVNRVVTQLRDSVRIVDKVADAKIDSMHKEVKQLHEIILKNDKTVAQFQKQIDALKADRKNVEPTMKKLSDDQMVRYMESMKIEKKK